jgi:methylmalonyl-CoA/ethylmalonyl-CoA epimerase
MERLMTLASSRIGQIAVNVKDIDRAVAFYRDTLGLRFLFTAPPQMGFFDCGGVRLMLAVPAEAKFAHPSSILYFKVDDIQAAHTALAGKGVTFEREPHLVAKLEKVDLWLAFFQDGEGNVMALMSEVARSVIHPRA